MPRSQVYVLIRRSTASETHQRLRRLFVGALLCVSGIAVLIMKSGQARDQGGGTAVSLDADASTDVRPLLPLRARDWVGLVVASVGLFLAAGGGIGGGGILVPCYLLVLGLPPTQAAALSNCTICGAAFANFVLNSRKRHPAVDRPLIAWDVVLAMEPSTMAGALAGTLLSQVLPEIATVLLMVAVLTLTVHRTIEKGLRVYRREEALATSSPSSGGAANDPPPPGGGPSPAAAAADEEACTASEAATGQAIFRALPAPPVKVPLPGLEPVHRIGGSRTRVVSRHPAAPLLDDVGGTHDAAAQGGDGEPPSTDPPDPPAPLPPSTPRPLPLAGYRDAEGNSIADTVGDGDGKRVAALAAILVREAQAVPPGPVLLVSALCGVVAGITYVKTHFRCGEVSYWLIEVAPGVPLCFSLVVARRWLLKMHEERVACGYTYQEGDVAWTPSAALRYPAICTLAGVCAGLFGIGGGIIKGPLMLQLGVRSDVAAATSATMILFTSLTTTTSYAAYGDLRPDFFSAFFCMGLVVSWEGSVAADLVVGSLRRTWPIIVLMAAVIGLSTGAMAASSAFKMWAAVREDGGGLAALFLPADICEGGGAV